MSKLWLPRDVFEGMKLLAKASFPLETGGMLLGYLADNGEVVVKKLIGPGPTAKHGFHHFEPDSSYQQGLLEKYFRESEGQITYLGDWHTHPLGSPVLSVRDKQTLAEIAQSASSKIKHPLMGVLAGSETDWQLAAFQFLSMRRQWLFRQYRLQPLAIRCY